ncbi:MAG: hypothetical protein JXR77_01730 [Lentisphaeria bacterium]|nr:hypothetical protein [Lentisphaeria bacterium]
MPGADARRRDAVCLRGTPAEVGACLGRIHGAGFREGVTSCLAASPRERLLEASRSFAELVRRYAPYWLEESDAVAREAHTDAEVLLAWRGARYRGVNRDAGECFTYCALPPVTRGGILLFHQNRDSLPRPQAAYLKHLLVPAGQVYGFAATGDVTDLGCLTGVNEHGLCVAADMGPPEPEPRFRGLMNTDILRLLLEQASGVESALGLLRDIHECGACAGGATATNWMLADPGGTALRVAQTQRQLEITEARSGILVMRDRDPRGEWVRAALERRSGDVDAALMDELGRTPPVLDATNVSAMTARVTPIRPDLFSSADFRLRHAPETLGLPLYLGSRCTPRAMLDGRAHAAVLPPPATAGGALRSFETRREEARRLLEQSAMRALGDAGEAPARRVLTEGTLRLVGQAIGFLETGGGTAAHGLTLCPASSSRRSL